MASEHFRAEQLTDTQTIELLSVALRDEITDSPYMAQFHQLKAMPPDQLSKKVVQVLRECELHRTQAAARLLGMSELTVRRWFGTLKPFPESVREKLAGLCLLLPLARDEACPAEVRRLILASLATLRMDSGEHAASQGDESTDLVASVFDTAGLMATALFLLVRTNGEDAPTEG